MIVYEIKNLGRSKWTGEVRAQSESVEHVEAALMQAAHKHLMSRDIDFDGDIDSGKIIVSGFRVVGEYRRKGHDSKGVTMKSLLVALSLSLILSGVAHAFDTRLNPDRYPSIGWNLHGGRLAGIAQENSAFTQFGADVRVPVTNYVTLDVDYTQTTVSNAPLGVSTDSNRVGASVRVYLSDFK